MTYTSGFGLPSEVLFDLERAGRLLENKWFFVGTRGDVSQDRDYFTFDVLGDHFVLVHGSDGEIRCFVNRCAHQSARVLRGETGSCGASLVCPNHQWSYHRDTGSLRSAPMMGADFMSTSLAAESMLTPVQLREVAGMLFACLGDDPSSEDPEELGQILAPYTDPYGLQSGGYKLAFHQREVVPANWLIVMINNRECCHCRQNHKGLLNLFDQSSFNGAMTPEYEAVFSAATQRWDALGRTWQEQAFEPNDCCRVARYPLREGFASTTFDGAPASQKLIGGWEAHRRVASHKRRRCRAV